MVLTLSVLLTNGKTVVIHRDFNQKLAEDFLKNPDIPGVEIKEVLEIRFEDVHPRPCNR